VGVYFEAAAVIVTLILLGQVIELRARSQTGTAIKKLLGLAAKSARLILENGNEEERRFFYNSWCMFDFAIAKVMAKDGSYERPHTLSAGDDVCDMRWFVKTDAPGKP